MLTTESVVPSTITLDAAALWLELPASDWLASTAMAAIAASSAAAKAVLRLVHFKFIGFLSIDDGGNATLTLHDGKPITLRRDHNSGAMMGAGISRDRAADNHLPG